MGVAQRKVVLNRKCIRDEESKILKHSRPVQKYFIDPYTYNLRIQHNMSQRDHCSCLEISMNSTHIFRLLNSQDAK